VRRFTVGVLLLATLAMPAAAEKSFKPFKLKTPEGVERRLSDVLGKATFVVFFYPKCPYCNAAFPEIQKLHDRYERKGLSMVWINVIPDQAPLIAEWRARHHYTVPVLLGGPSAQNDYKLVMTPTHYLLDSEGKVLSRRAGYTPGDEVELEREIRQALGLNDRP
jgi:peroxiredoxin